MHVLFFNAKIIIIFYSPDKIKIFFKKRMEQKEWDETSTPFKPDLKPTTKKAMKTGTHSLQS